MKARDNQPKDIFWILESMTEVVGWLQIVASISVLGGIFGGIIYLIIPNTIGFILGVIVASIGIVFSMFYATKIWKKRGTVNFISRISATPELDEPTDITKNSP